MGKTADLQLNVASTTVATKALGPGLRSVVWVQGCPFQCKGCVAPDWIPFREVRVATPVSIVEELLADPNVNGLTFSGGEPMLQAAGLAEVIRLARLQRDLSLICFTGFKLEQLHSQPPTHGISLLLSQIDVLIDGPYVAALNDNLGLRGSSNQRVHHLTDNLRHSGFDFEGSPRRAEVILRGEELSLVGVPPHHLLGALRAHERVEVDHPNS